MPDAENGFAGASLSDNAPVAASEEPPKGGLMSPSAKRILVIGGAILGLLIVAAVVGGVFLLWNAGNAQQTADSGQVTVTPPPTAEAVPAASTEAIESDTTATVPVSNDDVFSFRNPFQPTIAPVAVESSTDTSEALDPDVLTLQNIVSKDGELQAVLAFGGVTYTAGDGDQLGTTPWKVLSVSESSVSMLYGDVKVTLSLGEGVGQ